MALFTETKIRSAARAATDYKTKHFASLLNESVKQADVKISKTLNFSFDIFMSHSTMDAELIYGLKVIIEQMGYTVYIDWDTDGHLDRSRVTKETAKILKARMNMCRCLFFAHSINSPQSIWMPWELGYFDGIKPDQIAILPIVASSLDNTFNGQEYLGLYPYVNAQEPLWIHESRQKYVSFKEWLKGTQPYHHP